MAGITLQIAQAHLNQWLDADTALAAGKSYSIGGRSVTRADTMESIKYWQVWVSRLESSGIVTRRVVPRDL